MPHCIKPCSSQHYACTSSASDPKQHCTPLPHLPLHAAQQQQQHGHKPGAVLACRDNRVTWWLSSQSQAVPHYVQQQSSNQAAAATVIIKHADTSTSHAGFDRSHHECSAPATAGCHGQHTSAAHPPAAPAPGVSHLLVRCNCVDCMSWPAMQTHAMTQPCHAMRRHDMPTHVLPCTMSRQVTYTFAV